MMTQNTQDPVTENVSHMISSQRKDTGDPSTALLDLITEKALEPMILDKGIDIGKLSVERSATYGMLLPTKYTEVMIKNTFMRSRSLPSVQKVEFLLEGKEDTSLDVMFEFLQPTFQYPKEYNKNSKSFQRVKSTKIGSQDYRQEIYKTNKHLIHGNHTINELLSSTKEIPISINKLESIINYDKNGNDTGKQKSDIQVEQTAKALTGVVTISAKQLNMEGFFKVTVEVKNTSNITITKTKSGKDPNIRPPTVFPSTFFGTQLRITASSGKIFSADSKDDRLSTNNYLKFSLRNCSCLNTSAVTVSENELFASPVGVFDLPRIESVKMDVTLDELTKSDDVLLVHFDKLSDNEKEFLKSGKIGDLTKIFRALKNTYASMFDSLYQFQFDAIQLFIQALLANDPTPFIVTAPTDAGKSLVFYTCSAILKVLENPSGTSTFVTFPTKALNASQFNDMARFIYFLNRDGISISIGFYTGSNRYNDDPLSIVDPKKVTDGDPILLLRTCPNCNGKNIVASKKSDYRVVPKCDSCKEEFDFAFVCTYEISKFCPTIVVATPDKIHYSLTMSHFEHSLFGAPCKRCPKCKMYRLLMDSHKDEQIHICEQCNTQMDNSTKTQSQPSLMVFDEFHTMVGTFGNLFGQDISLLKVINEKYGITKPIRFIGATATIANQQELIKNLTGYEKQHKFPSDAEYWLNSGSGYFKKSTTDVRHRFIVLPPVIASTIDSVERMTLSCLHTLQKLKNQSNLPALLQKVDINAKYKIQTLYVNTVKDGVRMSQSIPTRSTNEGLATPSTEFTYSRLTRRQIFELLERVEENKLDVMITTSSLAYGIDFPNLNIMHFFGTPNSFIEMSQVSGRTGRGNLPSIVFLHMRPDIPRDKFVYEEFRKIFSEISKWYEPMPINVLNGFAMNRSLPNVTNALIIAKQATDWRNMQCNSAAANFTDDASFAEFMDNDLPKVYGKKWADSNEITATLKKLAYTAYQHIDAVSGLGPQFLSKALMGNKVLSETLRGTDVDIEFGTDETIPNLNSLSAIPSSQDYTKSGNGT